jgi:RHS repeat-associated protein
VAEVCYGNTSAPLAYTATTQSPTHYSIDFDAAANAAGINDVSNQSLSPSPIVIAVPNNIAPNTYNGTLTVSNALCVSGNYAIQVVVHNIPSGSLTSSDPDNEICAGDNVTFTQTSGDGVEYWKYTYDLLNRITEVKKNGSVVAEYGYDPEGLRIIKRAHGETIHYVFEGTEPIYEKNVTTGKVKNYIFAGSMPIARVDGVLGDSNSKKYWITTDHIGNYRAVTNDQGRVVWQSDYTAFGSQFEKSGDPDFEEWNGFTGKEMDPDTGLIYYNARWYDKETGRFISEDPMGDPNNPNLYSYCANNPIKNIDPTGCYYDSDGNYHYEDPIGPNGPVYAEPATSSPDDSPSAPTLPSIPDFQAPDAWDQYQNFWANMPSEAYDDLVTVNNLLIILWQGVDKWGQAAMPSFGWGMTATGDRVGPPNHGDTASMNMVKTIQAALGVTVDGKYGNETKQALQMLGLKGDRVGQKAINLMSGRLEQIINSNFVWPTTGRISSPYDPNRPGFKTKGGARVPPGHRAIDIANSIGTPVVALGDGTVIGVRETQGSGNILDIDYGGGMTSTYHHLNGYTANITEGTQVTRGQVVAYMGNTGDFTTGPHLHFAMYVNGVPVNPNNYLPPR